MPVNCSHEDRKTGEKTKATCLSTAFTDPSIASPPPSPELYRTPVISSKIPCTFLQSQTGLRFLPSAILQPPSVNRLIIRQSGDYEQLPRNSLKITHLTRTNRTSTSSSWKYLYSTLICVPEDNTRTVNRACISSVILRFQRISSHAVALKEPRVVVRRAVFNNMPERDENGQFSGGLYIREKDGNWNLRYFILDEGSCLLRYFDRNKSVSLLVYY